MLPICGKIFERLILNSLFEYLEKYKLLSPHQAFDEYPTLESRGVFLVMSKVFDKVWHEGLILKLKSMGICDALLDLIEIFLEHRFQRVVSNGLTSEWLPVRASVPQGSILGPLFFLIHINKLSIVSVIHVIYSD